MKTILILGCSSKKLDHTTEVVNLYQGGLWKIIRKRRPAVELYALSAKHGLVLAVKEVEPYDLALGRKTDDKFIEMVRYQFRSQLLSGFEGNIYFCGSRRYYRHLTLALSGKEIHRLPETPRGIGDMQAALVDFCESHQGTDVPHWHNAIEKENEV